MKKKKKKETIVTTNKKKLRIKKHDSSWRTVQPQQHRQRKINKRNASTIKKSFCILLLLFCATFWLVFIIVVVAAACWSLWFATNIDFINISYLWDCVRTKTHDIVYMYCIFFQMFGCHEHRSYRNSIFGWYVAQIKNKEKTCFISNIILDEFFA